MAAAGKDGGLYTKMKRYILTEDQLKRNGFPRPDPAAEDRAILHTITDPNYSNPHSSVKICQRCCKRSRSDGTFVESEKCQYHSGRKTKKKVFRSGSSRYDWVDHYECCSGNSSNGCTTAQHHVHRQNKYKDMVGYVQTKPVSEPPTDGNFGIYSVDCEMIYTEAGSELARVTVVDHNKKAVYEKLVKPDHPIVDYNTSFSGITESDLESIETTIRDVQEDLLGIFNDKSILIGHSLECDLIALKLIHGTIADTSIVFPHEKGPPAKRALRDVVSATLHRQIQNNRNGHCSQEDALACMELMLSKAK